MNRAAMESLADRIAEHAAHVCQQTGASLHRDRAAMASLRTAVKTARTAIDGKSAQAATLAKKAVATIDSAVTKGILKRETASCYVSRLARRAAP